MNIISKYVKELNNWDKSKKPAHNRSVYASPPVGGSGYEKPQSG
jgi:hypothetical protein